MSDPINVDAELASLVERRKRLREERWGWSYPSLKLACVSIPVDIGLLPFCMAGKAPWIALEPAAILPLCPLIVPSLFIGSMLLYERFGSRRKRHERVLESIAKLERELGVGPR